MTMTDADNAVEMAAVLDRLPGAVYAWRALPDGTSKWIYVNRRAAEMYDLEYEDLLADTNLFMKRMDPEDQAKVMVAVEHSMRTLEPLRWTGKITLKNGEKRWIESQMTMKVNEGGSLEGYGQILDVSEVNRALDKSDAERRRIDGLYRTVIDNLPLGVAVMNNDGAFEVWNPANEKMIGRSATDAPDGELSNRYGIFRSDGSSLYPNDELPLTRAMTTGRQAKDEVIIRAPNRTDVRLDVTAIPLRDENGNTWGGLTVSQDVTVQRALEDELSSRNAQLAASEEAKTGLIERLRYAIDELSNPILEVWDEVLAMPIIGVVDSRRTADMVQRLLAEVARGQARHVIIDLTGVEIVDTKTADHLIKLVRKVELVGARCMLTGIRPAVAQTLVDIGVDFGRLTTLRSLKHGLREALRADRTEREGRGEIEDRDDGRPTLRGRS